jgi:hypothetical protein
VLYVHKNIQSKVFKEYSLGRKKSAMAKEVSGFSAIFGGGSKWCL